MAGFPDGVPWVLQAAGPALTVDAAPLQARISQTTGHIQLAGPDLSGTAGANVVDLSPPAVLTPNGPVLFGAVISSTPVANGLSVRQAVGDAQIEANLTFADEGVLRYEVVDWGSLQPLQTAIAGPTSAQEHFFGFGEKFDALDQAGNVVDMLTFDDPGTKNDHSYKVAPWFISTRGYGFHLDSSAESSFDMRAGAADRFVVTNRFPTLRINLVYGPALTDVLTRYTGLTGRPPLPPPWAFGPWISSDIWRSGGEVRYAATQYGDRGIPASVFVFDSPWEVAYNDFQWNMTQFGADATIDGVHYPGFASPAEMLQFLQSNGLKVICWMTPFVNVSSGRRERRRPEPRTGGQLRRRGGEGGIRTAGAGRRAAGRPLVERPRQPRRLHQRGGTAMAAGPTPEGRRGIQRGDGFRRHRAGDRRVQDRRRRKRQRNQYLHTPDGGVRGRADGHSDAERLLPGVPRDGVERARNVRSPAGPERLRRLAGLSGLLGRGQRAELR